MVTITITASTSSLQKLLLPHTQGTDCNGTYRVTRQHTGTLLKFYKLKKTIFFFCLKYGNCDEKTLNHIFVV
jgi:hypothetical protein